MARILYAAGNRLGSYEQLKRYFPLFKKSGHEFKIAGYSKSINEMHADWCLDSLLDFVNPSENIRFNGNYKYYSIEINKFKPDLIISDFEIYTSYYAANNNIKLWQISPAILYYAISVNEKRNLNISKYGTHITNGNFTNREYIKVLLKYSEKKYVLSHFCDFKGRHKLLESYEWCRPEFELKTNPDNTVMCRGTELELADAFYNEQNSVIKMEEIDLETITATTLSVHYGLGKLSTDKLSHQRQKNDICIDGNVKFLLELIK